MPHFPKPFFRTARRAWFLQLDGKQIKLGENELEAFKVYHALMASRSEEPPISAIPIITPQPVAVVVDGFLDFVQKHRAGDTYRWYKDRLQSFLNSVPASITVAQLRVFHVQGWIDAQPGLATGSRRNLVAAVKRAMKWAEEQGYVDRSPIAHMKKPACGRKEQIVSADEFSKILRSTSDQEFQDLLTVTWEIGCRPQESLRVEGRHVDLAGSRWVFPASEAKGGKIPRVVYLTPIALEISKQLIAERPTGPLFRNTDGLPWTPDATNCRFQTLKRKLGVKYSLYALRHTWINRMLMNGVDAFTVAVLAGHSDPSMLAKHYAHLSQAPDFLRLQARRASA